MLREGPEGANYAKITGARSATVTRDLADMVANGALARAGERRYTRYFLTIPLKTVPSIEIDPKGQLVERV